MANLIDINNYIPKSMDNFFFDNNIWIYLFCPIGNHNKIKQKLYSSFLQKIRSSNATIWINSLVLSEFFNTSIKLDYNLWKDEELRNGSRFIDFKKDYRPTKRYKDTVNSINSAIKQILLLCQRCSDNFNALDLANILLMASEVDFNDSYYLEFCKLSSYNLVTDDKDCSKLNIKVNVLQG